MPRQSRSFVAANGYVLLTLGVGLFNNILIAAMFGLTAKVDAFFAAMVLPNLFMIVCVDYLGKNFLPTLAIARQESDESANQMTSTVVLIVLGLAIAVAALLLTFRGQIFSLLLPGFDTAETALVASYFVIMTPAIIFMAVTTFHEYVCQYDEMYSTVVLIRMALPLVNLAALLVLGPSLGEYSLPVGYTAGHIVVFALMAIRARYRFRPRLTLRDHLEKKIFTNSAIVMSTGLFARSKSIFVNYFASQLGGGVIAAIALATKITEPAQRSAFYAVRMILFSRTARLFQSGALRALASLYEFVLKASFLLLTPVIWWAGLHAQTIVNLLFGRGAIEPDKVLLIGTILAALIPSVLFLGVNQLLSNSFYAMNRIKVPALLMPVGTLLYALAAGPVSAAFGAPGLTLTTSLVGAALFLALVFLLARTLADFPPARTLLTLTSYAVWSGTCLVGCSLAVRAADLNEVAAAGVTLIAGMVLYAGGLRLVRDATLMRLLADGSELFARRATV